MSELLPPELWVPIVALFALAIGSFLNVVIYRVPAGMSIVSPPSACPGCKTPIKERDNIPVISWLILRGKCRECKEPISARYPLVEIATSIVGVVAVWSAETWPLAIAFFAVAVGGVALFMIDLDHQRLPLPVTGVTAAFSVPFVVVHWFTQSDTVSWSELVAGPAGGLGIWVFVIGGLWFASAGRAMGFGDVVLAPLLGLTLGTIGVGAAVAGLALAFFLGTLVGVFVLAAARRKKR